MPAPPVACTGCCISASSRVVTSGPWIGVSRTSADSWDASVDAAAGPLLLWPGWALGCLHGTGGSTAPLASLVGLSGLLPAAPAAPTSAVEADAVMRRKVDKSGVMLGPRCWDWLWNCCTSCVASPRAMLCNSWNSFTTAAPAASTRAARRCAAGGMLGSPSSDATTRPTAALPEWGSTSRAWSGGGTGSPDCLHRLMRSSSNCAGCRSCRLTTSAPAPAMAAAERMGEGKKTRRPSSVCRRAADLW